MYKHDPEIARTVAIQTAHGLPQAQLAKKLGISVDTLRKYYQEDLDEARMHCEAEVASTLYQMAVSGKSFQATAFYLKTRCGYSETTKLEVTDGKVPEMTKAQLLSIAKGGKKAA